MVVVGIDPGQTAGVAVIVGDLVVETFDFAFPEEFEEALERLRKLCEGTSDLTVVVEDFVGSAPLSAERKKTLLCLGACVAFATLLGARLLVQQPRERLDVSALRAVDCRLVKDRRLSPHERAALLHAAVGRRKVAGTRGEAS